VDASFFIKMSHTNEANSLPKIHALNTSEVEPISSDNVNLKAVPPPGNISKSPLSCRTAVLKTSVSSKEPMPSGGSPPIGRVVRDYIPAEEAELSLKEGDVVKVLKRYYKVQYGDRIGYLPACLLKVVDERKKSSKRNKSKKSSHKKHHGSRKHYSTSSGSSSSSESQSSSNEVEGSPRSHLHRHHHHGHSSHRHHRRDHERRKHSHEKGQQSEGLSAECVHQSSCENPQASSGENSSKSASTAPKQVTSSETTIKPFFEPTVAVAEASEVPAQVHVANHADQKISQQTVVGDITKSMQDLLVDLKDEILDACPGTKQGQDGWYSRGKERYYFHLQSTAANAQPDWELIYGPIDEKIFQSLAKKVLQENTCVELPPTELHPSGYYLNLDLDVQLGRDIILTACSGTEQGQKGWYSYNKHERYYFELEEKNGTFEWILIYGPIIEEKFKLLAQEVKKTGKRAQLPFTSTHTKPFYLEPNFQLTKG
jgi:hypothetical protein